MENERTKQALEHVTGPYLAELREMESQNISVELKLTVHEAAMLFAQLQRLLRCRDSYPLAALMLDRLCADIEARIALKPAVRLMFALTKNPAFDSTVNPNG
jgi:hypothetical protein